MATKPKVKAATTAPKKKTLTVAQSLLKEFKAKSFSSGTKFEGQVIKDRQLIGANLRGARFKGTTFEYCLFQNCDFEGAVLVGARFVHCAFAGSRMNDIQGYNASFDTCNMSGASFKGARLDNSSFRMSRGSGLDFTDASLVQANFLPTYLLNYGIVANWLGADVSRAILHGCSGPNFVDLGVDGRRYHFRAVRFADGWRITAGCRNFTLAQAVAHWKEKGNKDALARLAILKVYPVPSLTT